MEKMGTHERVKFVGSGGEPSAEALLDGVWPPHLPPWSTPSIWQQVTSAVDHHLGLVHIYHHRSAQLKAAGIERLMAHIAPSMEMLALQTCPECSDPCCRRATLWYDCTDLLFLGFSGQPWPPGQPMAAVGDCCRYLGEAGCSLPRIQRPWICTWYVCARQTALLRSSLRGAEAGLIRGLQGVKSLRTRLLEAFIRAALS